jgi:nucleotide-binding universal stress UspA family protein
MDRVSAINDFYEAHRKASLKTVMAQITGDSVDLLSYDEVLKRLRMKGQVERGREEIPLDKIIGSVGRYTDFTRDFLPRNVSDSARWASVKMATEGMRGVPPIDVYKVGEGYFVRDGNHRVSIARQNGQEFIEAYVIEVQTRVPLTAGMKLDDLIIKEEYAVFLEYTQIDKFVDSVDLAVTVAGAYNKLLDHISVHRYFMGINQDREVPYEEAVLEWYKTVYQPVVEVIREHGLLREFPRRTEADLYLWILEYRAELQTELGWEVEAATAAESLVRQFSSRTQYTLRRIWFWISDLFLPDNLETGPRTGSWRRRHRADMEKDNSLFRNILVTIQDNPQSQQAFEQALWIAQIEGARISGLHLVENEADIESDSVTRLRDHFNWRLGEVGVKGTLVVETGAAQRAIVERAEYTDLVAIHLKHAPGSQPFNKLRSGFRTLIRRCAQPLFVIPGQCRPIRNALLAYDGSPKSKEALFMAAHLARHWQLDLWLLTVYREVAQRETQKEIFEEAKSYLRGHDIWPHAHMRKGLSGENILKLATEKNVDLIIMGSYGAGTLKEVMLGSAIDYVLQDSQIPLLICR